MKTRLKPGDKVFYFNGLWYSLMEVRITKVVPSHNKPYDEDPQFDCCFFDGEDPIEGTKEIMTIRRHLFESESDLIAEIKKTIRMMDDRIRDLFGVSYIDERIESAIANAYHGTRFHAALTEWAEANNYVQSKVPLDERRYG